jgi:tRNA-splicing ligase RtcB (3'-phosphate/5'-hydroxy nucleic acid ligase)
MRIFGSHDEATLRQLAQVAAGGAERVALMADGHRGYGMPIGGVAAYRGRVSVVGVGFDIACGNAAVRTDLTVADVTNGLSLDDIRRNPFRFTQDRRARGLADEIAASVSFGLGRTNLANDAPVDDPLFLDAAWYAVPNAGSFRDDLRDRSRRQLGTVGGGNHYVDVLADTAGRVWVAVHFGSRGLGYAIAQSFLAIAQGGRWGEGGREDGPSVLDLAGPGGRDYWTLMELAGRYAHAGREWVARKVASILGGRVEEVVHNHHNFAWKETHASPDGEPAEYVVVRKGATPAFPGQRGFVGGSMGDDAVVLEGSSAESVDEEAEEMRRGALFSTVHGAGRVMSRAEAGGKRTRRGLVIRQGRVSPEEMAGWLARKGVILRGGGLDESPQAYRRLPEVLAVQGSTITVRETLCPLIVVMAGPNDEDPYKD